MIRNVLFASSSALLLAGPALAQARPAAEGAKAGDVVDASTIIVTARRQTSTLNGEATSGAFGSQRVLDAPFSITTIDAADIANRQALTINEALRGDASATPASNGYQNESSYVTVRGFTISGFRNNRIDDLPFYSTSSDAPLEAFERVQLLKGLSGFQYGFTAPGGIINYVLKKPTDTTQLGIDVGYTGRALGHASADLSGPFDAGGRVAYRLVGVVEDGETFTRDTYVRRYSGSAFLRVRPTDAITLDLSYLDSWRRQDGDLYGIIAPATFAIPAPIGGSRRIAQPYTSYETRLRTGGARAAWGFAPGWTLTADLRHSRTDREFRDSYLTLTSSKGDYSETNANFYTYFGGNQAQALVNGAFATGPLKHEVVLGVSALRQEVNRGKIASSVVLGNGNLAAPPLLPDTRPLTVKDTFRSQNIVEKAGFVSDTISIGDLVKLIGGLRYSKYDQDDFAYNATTAVRTQTRAYTKSPLTPSAALVVKPADNISLYGSYVQSLEPGGTAPATAANAFAVFAPLKSEQYEVGAKAQFGAFGLTAALFRIEKGLEYTTPLGATPANTYVQDGRQRNQGLELQANGAPVRGLTLSGGVTFLDARIRQAAPAITGKRPQGVARRQAALLADWQIPGLPAIALTGSVQYVGRRAVDATNVNFVAGYTVGSVGARYGFELAGKPVVARLSVENVTDKRYWSTSFGNIYPGIPRHVRLSIGTKL